MGPKQLHLHFIGRKTKKDEDRWTHNIADIPGRIGVDISGMMHRKMGTQRGAAVFDMNPEVPLFDALGGIMKDMRFLRQTCGGRDVTIFLDGKSHPMKSSEETVRQQKREQAVKEARLYHDAAPGAYESVRKLRPSIVRRREDFAARIAIDRPDLTAAPPKPRRPPHKTDHCCQRWRRSAQLECWEVCRYLGCFDSALKTPDPRLFRLDLIALSSGQFTWLKHSHKFCSLVD